MPSISRNNAPLHIYTPTLHRRLAPGTVPESVLFMNPGIGSAPDGSFTPHDLPLSPAEISSVLAELLSLGETLGPSVLRADIAGQSPLLSATEKEDLKRFAQSTPGNGLSASGVSTPDQMLKALKVLLLAWDLEERLMEIETLRQQVAAAAKPLAESLADPTGQTDTDGETDLGSLREFLEMPETPVQEPDWRLVLAAMTAFLPEGASLVTAHAGMRSALLESGMLHPLPEDVAEHLASWPEAVKSACLWASGVPVWRMIGHMRPPENAPWLARAPEVLICPAGRHV